MIDNQRLVMAMQGFLERWHYDVCLHTTFRTGVGLEMAIKSFKFFMKHLNTPEDWFFDKFIRCWTFFEKEEGGRIHLHSLIAGIPCQCANRLENKCAEFFGQSLVTPYDYNFPKDKTMTIYLSAKYPYKKLQHFEFFKINSRLRVRSRIYPTS